MVTLHRLPIAVLLLLFSLCCLPFVPVSAADRPEGGASTIADVTVGEVANLVRVPIIRQYNPFTCGVASLQSIFAYYGQDFGGVRLAKALGTTAANGTDYKRIIRVAMNNGYRVQKFNKMTLDELKAFIDAKTPVLLAIQAWRDKPISWPKDWKDGHYVVAIGYDADNVYFMDPSTVGNYTYIPTDQFLNRWHDVDQRGIRLVRLGIVIDGKTPVYDPDQIKSLD